jgi:asparagine synthase (glutamine-hydrolysing)
MGFGVPIDHWLRGPLRDWAEHLLDDKRLRLQGLLDPSPIRQRWEDHVSGNANWAYPLWNVLMLQAWLNRNPGVALH